MSCEAPAASGEEERKFVFTPFIERKWRAHFNCFDYNKDGKVTVEDAYLIAEEAKNKKHLTEEAVAETKEQMTKVYEQCIAMTSEGTFGTADDLIKSCSQLTEAQVKAAATVFYGSLFDAVDTNKNGVISLDEFLDFVDLANVGRQSGKATFKLIDSDKDDNISRDEFMDFALRYVTSNDESDPSKFLYGPLPNNA